MVRRGHAELGVGWRREKVSHVTVCGAWGEKGKGVTCYGFCVALLCIALQLLCFALLYIALHCLALLCISLHCCVLHDISENICDI